MRLRAAVAQSSCPLLSGCERAEIILMRPRLFCPAAGRAEASVRNAGISDAEATNRQQTAQRLRLQDHWNWTGLICMMKNWKGGRMSSLLPFDQFRSGSSCCKFRVSNHRTRSVVMNCASAQSKWGCSTYGPLFMALQIYKGIEWTDTPLPVTNVTKFDSCNFNIRCHMRTKILPVFRTAAQISLSHFWVLHTWGTQCDQNKHTNKNKSETGATGMRLTKKVARYCLKILGYGTDDRGIGVLFFQGARNLFLSTRSDSLWSTLSFLVNGSWECFTRSNEEGSALNSV
jgi:hypothetical protein